uniref:Uncharacterized protein n=1 Tax=Arundo donax TaxID=35708 RepID=A0A0A9BRI2_ARUDO
MRGCFCPKVSAV